MTPTRKTFARLFHHMGACLEFTKEEVLDRDPTKLRGLHRSIRFVVFHDVYSLTAEAEGKIREFETWEPENESARIYFGTAYTAAEIEERFSHVHGLVSELRANGYERMVKCHDGMWSDLPAGSIVIPYPGKN